MNKITLTIIIILGLNILFAQEKSQPDSTKLWLKPGEGGFISKYSNDLEHYNRLTLLGITLPHTKHYMVDTESPLTFVWLSKDKINSNNSNISIMPALEIGILLSHIYLIKTESINHLYHIISFTNSSHNFYFHGNPDKNENRDLPLINMAFFVKNNTDLFLFQSNNWLQVSPGAGLKFLHGAFALDVGYQMKYQFIDDGTIKNDPSAILSLTIYSF